jgi:hypothetical protein
MTKHEHGACVMVSKATSLWLLSIFDASVDWLGVKSGALSKRCSIPRVQTSCMSANTEGNAYQNRPYFLAGYSVVEHAGRNRGALLLLDARPSRETMIKTPFL